MSGLHVRKMNKKLKVYDGAGIVLSCYIFAFVGANILAVIVMAIAQTANPDIDTAGSIPLNYGINAVMQLLMLLSVVVYGFTANYNPWKSSKLDGKMSSKQLLLLVPVTIACIVAFLPLANIFVLIIESLGYSQSSSLETTGGVGMFFLNFFFICLLPAFCEEFVFRAGAANAFRSKGYVFAIVMSGLMFGLFHFSGYQLIHQMLLGMVCAYVFFVSRSFWAAFAVHFLNNLIALILEFSLQYTEVPGVEMTAGSIAAYCAIMLAVAVAGCALLFLLLKAYTKMTRKQRGLAAPAPKKLNPMLAELFETEEEKLLAERERIEKEQAFESAAEAERKYLEEKEQTEKAREKKRTRNSMIGIFLVLGLTWAIFFGLGFTDIL